MLDGSNISPGRTIRIDADVYSWESGTTDRALFFYAADADNPSWTHFVTVTPSAGGFSTVSVVWVVPTGGGANHAIRVAFRYNNAVTSNSCVIGKWSEVDPRLERIRERHGRLLLCLRSFQSCLGMDFFEKTNGRRI